MTDEPTPPITPVESAPVDTPAPPAPALTWHSVAIAAVFGFVYAYFVYQAIRNLIELPKSYAAIGLGESVPWLLLVIGLLIPIAIYVVAFIIGLRRRVLDKAIIFVLGLAVAAGAGYSIVAVHRLTFDALIASL